MKSIITEIKFLVGFLFSVTYILMFLAHEGSYVSDGVSDVFVVVVVCILLI